MPIGKEKNRKYMKRRKIYISYKIRFKRKNLNSKN